MSYYDNTANSQWSAATQNNWEHQAPPARAPATTPAGPSSGDDFAFSYQFDEVERAQDNLVKSGKVFGMGGPGPRHGRLGHQSGRHGHGINDYERSHGHGHGAPNYYQSQRHHPGRGSGEPDQVLQAKRRMAAQRERELRNLHTEQQFQRLSISSVPESSFAPGVAPRSGSGVPLDNVPGTEPVSQNGMAEPQTIQTPSPSGKTGVKNVYDGNNGSPTGVSPGSEGPIGSKTGQAPVAPIGTRPSLSGPSTAAASNNGGKRATSPITSASPSNWGRNNSVWGQSSGLGTQASVWG